MTCIGSEIETLTSEDFGFKKLGQAAILPSYDERLPFASLQNLDISNHRSLYVACSGNKIVIGKLQQLRDYIQNDAKSEISFIWEREVDDVIAVKLIRDEKLVYVNKQSQVFELDLNKLGEPSEVFNFDCDLVYVKFWRNSVLLALDSNGQLRGLHLVQRQLTSLLENVAAFDLFQDKLYAFFKSFSVQVFELQSWNQLSKNSEFTTPSELLDEIKEEYLPISITVLASQEYQLVFGIPVSADEEDVSYDHRIFVVRKDDDKMTFQESFDITPAFGSVLRYPMYYDEKLSQLLNDTPQINILASSCSSEITIWDSAKVVQPLQDSERAVLPISKVTDNDTNPVGIALDVVTEGVVAQPCPGVDSVDKLPLIYVLNNEGNLQIIGFYHATAIKEGKFNVDALKQSIVAQETVEEVPFKESEAKDEPKKLEDPVNSLGGLSLGGETNKTESKPLFGGLGQADSGTTISQDSSTSNQPSFGKPSFGQSSFGQSSFGKPAFGQSSSDQSPFGQSSFGTPAFGQSSSGQSPFGQSAFGKPAFGQSSSESSAPAFGKTSFGAATNTSAPATESSVPAFGKPSFGVATDTSAPATESSVPAFGKPSFGAAANTSSPAFGQHIFGKSGFGASSGNESALDKPSEPAFGKAAFGQPSFGQPSFGQSSFGQPSFGSTTNGPTSSSSTFGKPSFGSNSNTGFGAFAFSKEKSPFESSSLNTSGSSFGNFAKGQSKSESPFANLVKKENDDNKSLFGAEKKDGDTSDKPKLEISEQPKSESSTSSSPPAETKPSFSRLSTGVNAKSITTPEKPTFGHSTLGSISSNKKQSPFAALAKDENLPVFTSPSYGASTSRPSFGQASAAPSSPSKQKFSPLGQKEGKKEEEEDKNAKEGKKAEDSTEEEKTSTGKKSSPDNDDDLSDSTVEQTPARSESSISSLTAKIKESATLSSNDLKSPSITQQPKSKEGQSPFAQYTNDLNKPSSTGFTFSQVPNLNKEKEDSNNEFKLQISTKDDKRTETQTPESSENEGTLPEDLENSIEGAPKDSVSSHPDEKGGYGGDDESQPKTSEVKKEGDRIKSSSPTALNAVSREESYDTLDDFTRGELENAGIGAKAAAEGRKDQLKTVESAVSVDAENSSDDHERSVQTQASPPVLVSSGTQVEKAASGDADCQTNPIELSDFKIQAFENDDAYLGEQYRPKPMPEYFSGASVTNIKYSSQDPILKSIERTYHYVSAELSVLMENISGLDSFFQDQCFEHPVKINESSITNMYQWRIPDASKLQTILAEKNKPMKELYGQVESTSGKVSELTEKGIESLQNKLIVIRDEYSNLEKLSHEFQKAFGGLRYHQLDKQSELRNKMFKTSETIQHIEELLQILKLYTVQGKQMESNTYVVKLAREAADRENLLQEIARLREDIRNLNLKDERALEPKESSAAVANGIQSIEVVQVGLKLNTKRQLGEMLKKRTNIET
ncbi:hypothetical protein ZYGR_0A00790 [Zygosaccharomyces rouxii]|uniref:Nucleoporin Nup159/Nup146 N-terminal domain-containing protein n=1 Tax=Zygosaccharomyces rouxii TaxID=4956 RepID=A0A1Q2ZSN5_ZYGRO|nr:hypothetical protein ZYGR_0A00790 [Zygosaccharomyces rouxii]